MFDKLIVEVVDEDKITCRSSKNEKVSLDIEGLVTRFEVGDEIVYAEQGFYDIYRNDEVVGGLSNLFTRLIK